MRIGIGYDIHRLKKDRLLILGGILIPHNQGLEGHSDADVLTHAVCDALLGAMNEGDLGRYYPSSDPEFKDMDSLEMLKGIAEKLAQRGFHLVNLDTVIIAQAPRLGSYLSDIAKRLAEVLDVTPDLVSVKVKSSDHIGAIGRMEGIASQAVCLIESV
jgi:2-C-methyl-D-erythritol 2,4-cyclodiphosphate synthase